MRLGAPVTVDVLTPDHWIAALRAEGYRAAYWPLPATAAADEQDAFVAAAAKADIVIAEVGAWSNPLDADPTVRANAIAHNQAQLALADRVGARCCVNIAGSKGPRWDGPSFDNLSQATFDEIVETVRTIIDAVKPTRTHYTLEPMPWIFPDGPDSYLDLLHAIDRPAFGVHLDPVNWINSPRRYIFNGEFLRECFAKLGPYIVSVHAKDTILGPELTTHLSEARPGEGKLDYATLLRELDRLPADTPIMLEHLPTQEDYVAAAAYVRQVARGCGVML